MTQLVYKIVRRRDGKLVSLTATDEDIIWGVEYSEEWVKAPEKLAGRGYYLTAFRDRESAEKGYENTTLPYKFDLELWAAEADGLINDGLPHCEYLTNLRSWLDPSYWMMVGSSNPPRWAKGTVMAKRLRLVKKLKEF